MKNPYETTGYELLSVVRETEIDYTFRFRYEGPLVGGQFMEVSIPGVGEAPISISEFDDHSLSMTIRKVGHLTDRIMAMGPGDRLQMRGPYGNGFDLSLFQDRELVIIAGGTGLAPVKTPIRHFVQHPETCTSLELIMGFKSPDDILFREEIDDWATRCSVTLTVDNAPEGWTGKTGLVTTHIRNLNLTNAAHKRAIVVGPPVMMKFTTLELLKHGFTEDNIWVSFERKMSCGIGKCGHCKIDETYVCLDGPVFPYTKARRLLD